MAFRSPSASSSSIFSLRDVSTAAATTTYQFTVPQDGDSVVAKIWLQPTWNASGTCTVIIQTTEDGGTTWRDISGTTIGASTVAASFGNQNAHFIPITCIGATDHGVSNYVGSVAASTVAAAAVNASVVGNATGLPLLGTLGRVQVTYTATITTGGLNVDIFAPTNELR